MGVTSEMRLAGGSITGNKAMYEGGGIHCLDGSTQLLAQGSPICTGNIAAIGKNLLIGASTSVGLPEKVTAEAKLDFTTKDASAPLTNNFRPSGSDIAGFTYNESAELIEERQDNLFFKQPAADTWVSDWKALQNAINDDANQGKIIGLSNDISANGEDRLYVGDKNVTIELCGYKLDRQLDDDDKDGHVFEVEGGNSSLTIKDAAGTGVITGGYAEHGGAINIHGGSVCTIESGTVTGNRASDEGGGIFVYGTLNMTGGSIVGNSGDDCGGIYVHEDGVITLENVNFSGNRASEHGGGAINNKGVATLKKCLFEGNSAKAEGGGVYNNSDLVLKGCTIGDNQSAHDGGGISSYGMTSLEDCTIKDNTTEKSGGALRVHDATTSIAGGEIHGNKAGEYGGGIYVNDSGATLSLTNKPDADVGSSQARKVSAVKDPAALRITKNEAAINGGGIWVANETGSITVQGKIAVFENEGGSNLHLASGKTVTVNGELARGTNIGVSLESDLGVFTSNYASFNPHDDPGEFFASDVDYRIVRKGDEVELKEWIFDPNEKEFIAPGSRVVRDYNKLNSTNWMAGLSGEKYLYEINMPGTHDTGTKSVEGNISTGNISYIAAGLGVAGGFLTGLGGLGALGGGLALPVIVSDAFEKYANCQVRYVDEQLQDGIRQFDIRLNTYYAEQGYPIDNKDDGENLWLLHGKDKMGGSYFAKNSNGDFLNFSEVLSYYKTFLARHPTETLIVSVQIDSVDIDDVYDEGVARIGHHLRQLSQEVNPATNEPYLYMEGGVFNKPFSHYPQLKDCRGKIVINADPADMSAGGFGGLVSGTGINTIYRPEGDFHDHADEKINHLTAFYQQYAGRPLATDAATHIDYYYSVGTNGTDDSGPFSIPTVTPLEIADEVLPVMFDDPGLVVGREGTYLGLVNMDGEQVKEATTVWKSNYFDGLEYCTVTVNSGLDDGDTRVYTVLKNTPLNMPGNIFDAPDSAGEFKGWKATATAGDTTAVALSGTVFQPGAKVTISEDATFTAQWSALQESGGSENPETPGKKDDPATPTGPTGPTSPTEPTQPGSQVEPSSSSSSSSSSAGSSSSSSSGSGVSPESKSSSSSVSTQSSEQSSTSSGSAQGGTEHSASSSQSSSSSAAASTTETQETASSSSGASMAGGSTSNGATGPPGASGGASTTGASGGAGANGANSSSATGSQASGSGAGSNSAGAQSGTGASGSGEGSGGDAASTSASASAAANGSSASASKSGASQSSDGRDAGVAVPQIFVTLGCLLALGAIALVVFFFRKRREDDGDESAREDGKPADAKEEGKPAGAKEKDKPEDAKEKDE